MCRSRSFVKAINGSEKNANIILALSQCDWAIFDLLI
jgi:hypothetical protein